jgi:hypothetical protein
MSKQMYQASCHCKAVRVEAQIDLSKGTSKCNCSFCEKTRYWGIHVKTDDFKLLTGADQLRSYSRTKKNIDYDPSRVLDLYENDLAFCKTCGTHTFNTGNIPEIGGLYVSLNVACLDDVDFEELMKAPIEYMNGKDDDWFSKPKYSAHL